MAIKIDLPTAVEDELRKMPKEQLDEFLVQMLLKLAETLQLNWTRENLKGMTYRFE